MILYLFAIITTNQKNNNNNNHPIIYFFGMLKNIQLNASNSFNYLFFLDLIIFFFSVFKI